MGKRKLDNRRLREIVGAADDEEVNGRPRFTFADADKGIDIRDEKTGTVVRRYDTGVRLLRKGRHYSPLLKYFKKRPRLSR
jgi:hypothetical protein